MIEFPKIPDTRNFKHDKCTAFVKYDGSNIGAEYSKAKGFHKFRLRSRLFDTTDKDFGPAIPLFLEKFAEPLAKAIVDAKLGTKTVVFGEFYGDGTFAGNHYKLTDEQKKNRKIIIFDVWKDNYGFIGPKQFRQLLEGVVPIPEVVFEGKYTGKLVEDVRNGKYKDKGVEEGVILKAGKGGEDIEYAKVKTTEYLEKLKQTFGNKWTDFGE